MTSTLELPRRLRVAFVRRVHGVRGEVRLEQQERQSEVIEGHPGQRPERGAGKRAHRRQVPKRHRSDVDHRCAPKLASQRLVRAGVTYIGGKCGCRLLSVEVVWQTLEESRQRRA